MKTLKKSLCLILALVFVLGLCTIGAGAAFTDDADINYDDAVSVMQGLGILKGYEDGSFQPAKNVTRAEAATMITKMILGEAAAAKLPAASAFADVPASNWAAPYVNFCATKGIIVGYGDGNFGPNDSVTGLQMAKMLLVACGYGEMNEFSPDTWEIYTFTYAVENDILDGVDVEDFSAPATREECAQYVFNTLWVTLMKYDVDLNDYIDKTYDKDGKNPINYANKVWDLGVTSGLVIANQATGEDYTLIAMPNVDRTQPGVYLGFDLNDIMPIAAETGADELGHKIRIYYNVNDVFDTVNKLYYYVPYQTRDISTVYATSNANPFVTKTLGDLAKEMGYPKTNFKLVTYIKDGVADGTTLDMYTKDMFGGDYFVSTDKSLSEKTIVKSQSGGEDTKIKLANGSYDSASTYLPVDKLVVDEYGDIISAVKNTYTYGKVTAVDEEEGIVEFATCEGAADWDWTNPAAPVYEGTWTYTLDSASALLANCYEGIAKDDIVLIERLGDEIDGIYKLTATTTMTTQITQTGMFIFTPMFNGSIYADSAASYWNDTFLKDEAGTYAYPAFSENIYAPGAPILSVGDTVKFYVGKNGNVFAAVILDEASSEYLFLTGAVNSVKTTEWNKDTVRYYAQAVDAEGNEISTLCIGYKIGSDALVGASTVASDGLYCVKKQSVDGNVYYALDDTDVRILSINGEYKGTEAHVDDQPHYLTSATKYIYVDGKESSLKIKKGTALSGANVEAYYVAETGKVSNIATIWIVGEQSNIYTGDYIFANNSSASGQNYINGAKYDYYSVKIDGESVSITLDGTQAAGTVLNGFYSYKIDSNGLYKLTPVADGDRILNQKVNYVNNGLLMVAGVGKDIVADDFEIVDLNLYGYQDAKHRNHKITDAETLAEAIELGYNVTISCMYDSYYKVPVGVLYVNY